MNYGQIRDTVLKLLNQYTNAGERVAGSYNNQQDYIERIPALVNDAVMEIATTARKIPSVLRLSDLGCVQEGNMLRYELPADFYQFISGRVVTTKEGRTLHTNCFLLQGRKTMLIPAEEAGDYTVEYYRYPALLSDRPADTAPIDNEPETHFAIPYYVASYLVAHDDAFLCSLFGNKFADKLSKMSPGISAEVRTTGDVYGFFG